mgnify:CR=1 FL=1
MPLTDHQELAAESRGGARLVSAAAGSGKTKVLVERLMRYVDRGADIDQFLVITYTRAAAAELRSRILSALGERIAADPMNRRLRRQTELCCRASIGTIDGICGRFLRENTHLAGISPDYRVIEPDRSDEICERVLDKLLEELYETIEEDAGVRALVDSFGSGDNDDKLSALVLRLYNSLQSHADPDAWLAEQRERLTDAWNDVGDTPWGQYLLSRTRSQAQYWAERIEELRLRLDEPDRDAKIKKAYGKNLDFAGDAARDMARAAALGWDKARLACPGSFPRRGIYKGDDPLAQRIIAVWTGFKDTAAKWQELFANDSDALLRDLAVNTPAVDALLALTQKLGAAFAAEKKRQGVCDFSDQEHLVLKLLMDSSNGLAAALSSRYTEVLVDEYQDVNACQDALFRLLSDNGRKLFMVGDVKQSIYRFRLADPTIFLKKYETWPDIETAEPCEEPGRILLRENFRSRPEVLESANHVFRNIMSRELGELEYDEAAALRPGPGRDFPVGGGAPTEFCILTPPGGGDDEDEDDERPDKVLHEARYIASRIRRMVDERTPVTEDKTLRPCTYGDFAILLRSNKAVTPRYRAALAEQGIPSVSQQGGGFFRSTEITSLLALLGVIDNPHQDVPLIAVLRSPLFGFTPDELSAIRAADRNSDYYTALCLRAKEDEHCAAFLVELESYREIAPDLSIEALLARICDKAGVFALLAAMPDGAARRENVCQLIEFARQFEQDGYRGVFRFIRWMKQLDEHGKEPRTGALESRNAVQIISIHHSKGLEYPIVFLADTAHKINLQDRNGDVLIHPSLGIGGRVIDSSRGISYPTIALRAISAKLTQESLSEEMRVLYVAMTRPKDRLIITATWKTPEKTLDALRDDLTAPIAPQLLEKSASLSRWIALAALLPDSPIDMRIIPASGESASETAPPEIEPAEPGACAALSEALTWEYPYRWAEELPSKITASALEGTDADPDAQSIAPEAQRRRLFRRPVFGAKDAPLTGTARGIAVHTVLQFIDYSCVSTPEQVRAEIERLKNAEHITPAQAAAVEPKAICKLFASPIGQRILHADEVWRELRFSLLTGAETVFDAPAGEEVLLQGVADCCIREGDTLTVVDYKTDYVTAETLAARASEYAPQVRAYAAALTRLLGKPVREGVLFFLRTGESVSIDCRAKK